MLRIHLFIYFILQYECYEGGEDVMYPVNFKISFLYTQ